MFTTAAEIVRRRTGPNTRRCAHSCAWLPLTELSNGYCSKVKNFLSLASGQIRFVVTGLAVLVVVFVGVRGDFGIRSVGSEVKTCFSVGKVLCSTLFFPFFF